MQDTIDAEPMYTHCLHHCVTALLAAVLVVAFIRIENDSLRLLVSHDLAHSPVLGETAIALVQLLNDAKLLALRDSSAILPPGALAQILQLHVLQYDAIEAHGELLFGEVRFAEYGNFEYRFFLLDWTQCAQIVSKAEPGLRLLLPAFCDHN